MIEDREKTLNQALTRANEKVKQTIAEKTKTVDQLRQTQEELKINKTSAPAQMMSGRVKELEKQLIQKDQLVEK